MIRNHPCLAIAALAVASCGPAEKESSATKALPDLKLLEELAAKDCACRFAGIAENKPGSDFAALTKEINTLGTGTSSVPASYENLCFPEFGEDACIFIGGYIPPRDENFFCTLEQGLELEEVWNNAESSPNGTIEKADARIIERLVELRSEARKNVSQLDCQ